jgi:hypothetical protein
MSGKTPYPLFFHRWLIIVVIISAAFAIAAPLQAQQPTPSATVIDSLNLWTVR